MSKALTLTPFNDIRVKNEKGVDAVKENIEKLKKRLDKEIEDGCPYEQILKTSKQIDELLVEYYLEDTQDIT